jgi:hypothetical protein
MKKLLLLFLSVALLSACSSDDSPSSSSKTKAIITLKNPAGNAVSNVVVYAYDQTTWEVIGDQTQFADFQASSDSQGIATFENIFSDTAFNTINNYQNTFRFSVRYSLNGNNKVKFIPITFSKGETKTGTIMLN